MHRSAASRTLRRLTLGVLAAALSFGAAPAAHATWRTGNGEPPAFNDEHICVDGIDWTFAWFPPTYDPNAAPPSPLSIEVGIEGGEPLTRGIYDLRPSPLQMTRADILDNQDLYWMKWRDGKVGLFDFHATFRIVFGPGVRLPVGSPIRVTWQWSQGHSHMIYAVERCTIAAFPPAEK
jgi:hypothetical protein